MKKKTFLTLTPFIFLLVFVLAADPPSLENHQFYGYVFWNESASAATPETVSATLGTNSFPSTIKDAACVNKICSGKYGYSSDNILRVKGGKKGDLILFKVDSLNLKNYTYEPEQATQLNFSLFADAILPAIDTTLPLTCTSNWNCSDWNACTDQKQTRTCNDLNSCNSSQLTKTEEQSCGTTASTTKKTTTENKTVSALGCPYLWDCSLWSECSIGGTQTRTCTRSDSCDQKFKDGKVPSVIALPKPNEKKVCSAVETTPQPSAPPSQKFTPPTPPAAPKETPALGESSFWTYILIIAIVIVLIAIGALVYFLKKSKGGGLTREIAQELSETYAKGAQRGLSEEEITEKLATRGWDEKTLQKFLRSR